MSGPLRVLLVEDEALILMQLKSLVEEAGHVIVGTAMRCGEAIGLARTARADLAFVDLSLCDGGSGVPVAQALTAAGSLVMFVTANPMRLGEDFAGAAGVIAKPFNCAVVADGIAYLETCVRRPPPTGPLPSGMRMASRYLPR